MIPTSRCTIYPDTFIGACLFSALRNTSGNDVPSQWITRGVARREKKKRKKREEVEEEQEVEEEKVDEGNERGRERRTREASDRDYRRREREGGEGEGKKMIVASTQRAQAYIYLCVASQCWAFVVLDDGRLSRETTSEAFASSSSSSSLSLLRLLHLYLLLLLLSHLILLLSASPGLPSVCVVAAEPISPGVDFSARNATFRPVGDR